jgi:hypothetical protein
MQSDSPPPSDLETLQKQIPDLTEVYNKLQTLRQIPSSLLVSTATDIPFRGQPRSEFQRLKEIGESIRSFPIQEGLHRAQHSQRADAAEINANPRRENRKRR